MNRSPSPVHLHLNRKAPVHVHVSTSPRPERKIQSSTSRRMRASDWVKASAGGKGPWIPPPGKTKRSPSTHKMSWEGPTHRLDIEPVSGDGTYLHVSDLDGGNGSTDIILEPAGDGSSTQYKLDNLTAEVNTLRNEVDLLQGGDHSNPPPPHPPLSSTSHKKSSSKTKHVGTLPKLEKDLDDVEAVNSNRESLLQSITETELDLNSVNRQIDLVREALRLLIRDKSLSPSRAREATEQSIVLQDRVGELQMGLKATKQLLRSQQVKESKIKSYSEEIETLQRRLLDSERLVKMLQEQLLDKERLAVHSHQLHQQVTDKENNIQELSLKLQTLQEKIERKEIEYTQLESEFESTKRKANLDKEALKRSNKQHKDKAWMTEKSVESLKGQVDHLTSELEIERSKSSRLVREKAQIESNLQSLRTDLKEFQDSNNEYQYKMASKSRENGTLQLENEQYKATIASLEGQLRANESTANTKISVAQSESRELQSAIAQYEGLVADYKIQLDKSHQEIDRLIQEIHEKDQEIERLQHDSFMELEKSKITYQKQLSELEPLSTQLKTTEIKLQESQEKLSLYEQRNSDQTKMIAELTAKSTTIDSMKDKLQEKKAELKVSNTKMELLQKRLNECETQNRELLTLNSKKEELVRQLQFKEENYIEEVSSLNRQLESLRADSRKDMEEMREKASFKERSQMARQVDLETQLKRVNAQLNQVKKSKEENERKLHCKVRELQEKLDHSQATKKALESYLSFIKSSYASIFNDTSVPSWESSLAH